MSSLFTHFAAACTGGGDFLAFPTWYKYLNGSSFNANGVAQCVPKIEKLSDFWLVAAAIIEILLRIGMIAAIAYVIYGGVMLITSEGNPDKVARAKNGIINAVVGIAIAVGATAIITFVAGRF